MIFDVPAFWEGETIFDDPNRLCQIILVVLAVFCSAEEETACSRQQPVPKIEDPTPIRTPSQVMRIWIAPWEDADGDLMVSNYIYTELEPRRWMIGKAAPTANASLIPLQVEQRPPEKRSSVDTAEDESPVNRLGKQMP